MKDDALAQLMAFDFYLIEFDLQHKQFFKLQPAQRRIITRLIGWKMNIAVRFKPRHELTRSHNRCR